MRVAFKHYPLASHPEARNAARVAILAQERGKFWDVHDALFRRMGQLGTGTYVAIGEDHGIPEADVRRVLEERAYEGRIGREVDQARRYRVKITPTSFVNGRRVRGARDYEDFRELVDQALASTQE